MGRTRRYLDKLADDRLPKRRHCYARRAGGGEGGRPAKCPGISGSLQKWRVICRSPGIVKKSPGIEGI